MRKLTERETETLHAVIRKRSYPESSALESLEGLGLIKLSQGHFGGHLFVPTMEGIHTLQRIERS